MPSFLSCLLLIIGSLFLINCEGQTSLPKEMPNDVKMRFSENGGMSPFFTNIEIEGDTLTYQAKLPQDDRKEITWKAKISAEDKLNLYNLFVENKIDLIKNKKKSSTTYDAGSEGIYISIAPSVYYSISYGDNFPLSTKDQLRYQTVANEFEKLVKKYETMQEKTGESAKPKSSTESNSAVSNKFMIFYFDPTKHNWIFKDGKSSGLANTELLEINSLLSESVSSYNTNQKSKINLNEYKFQYLPIINSFDEKEIWVNAFCGESKNWKEELVLVKDGGKCYWQTIINLTKKSVESLRVNGEA